MKINRELILVAIITICLVATSPNGIGSDNDGMTILTVGGSGNFTTIASALENASDGDRLVVQEGMYPEIFTINKSVEIIGAGQDRTAIIPSAGENIVVINSDSCTISGLAFLGSESTCVSLKVRSDDNTIKDCYFQGASSALMIENGTNNLVSNNTFSYNGDVEDGQDIERLQNGLVAYWSMEDEPWSGQKNEVKDSSLNGLHGTAMMGANLVIDGQDGQAGHFDGSDDFIELDDYDELNFGEGPFSISAWINLDSDVPSRVGNKIIQKRGGRDKSWGEISGWMIAVQREGDQVFAKNIGIDDGMGNSIELAPFEYVGDVETWIHLVVTWDATTAKLYVDGGSLVYSRSNPNIGNINSPKKASIGCHWNDPTFQDQFFHGLIDEVRVYDRALEMDDVYLLYNDLTQGAIILDRSTDNMIMNNTISNNAGVGISYRSSDDNIATNNLIFNNMEYSLTMDSGSSGNLVYKNEILLNNGENVQAYDGGQGNFWDLNREGNYWADWTAPDVDKDWIVDLPYQLDGGASSSDNFPLIHPSDVNTPPEMITSNKVTAYVGELYDVQYEAIDSETLSSELEWSIDTNASWLISNTSWINGTPSKSDIGSYWVDISVSDGEFTTSDNFTLWVIDRTNETDEHEYENNDDTIPDTDFEVGDLFPPKDNEDAEYVVEDNEDIEVEINDDGSIKVDPVGEWEGIEDIEIEQSIYGSSDSRSFKVLLLSENSENERPTINYDKYEDQILVVAVDPDLDMKTPFKYRWDLEDHGQIGARQILRPNLLPGEHVLSVKVTDNNSKEVTGSYILRIGITEDEDDNYLANAIFLILAIFSIMALLVFVILVGITFRKRDREISTDAPKQIGTGSSSMETSNWRERKGPSPGNLGDGSVITDLSIDVPQVSYGRPEDHGLNISERGRSLDRTQTDGQLKAILEIAVNNEAYDHFEMTDQEIIELLHEKRNKGEISKDTYGKINGKLNPE